MSRNKIRNILVTGGAGFVGRHTAGALLKKGFRVCLLDNFSNSSRAALKPYAAAIKLVEGDIRHVQDVRKALAGIDAVFHFAALRSVVKSVEDPFLSHEVNATGTLLLLEEANKAGVRHFIFTSTSAVYGAAISRVQKETGALRPISPYGMAKLLAEHYVRYYFEEKGMPATSVRIFNVYGPRQNPESQYSLVVPGILSKILKGRRPVIDGTGEQARDFIYIGDIVEAFFKILGNKKSSGQVYNLGSGTAASVNTLVKTLLGLTASGLKPIHGPRRPGDPDRTCADISKIKRELGWRPKVSLKEGLKKTIREFDDL